MGRASIGEMRLGPRPLMLRMFHLISERATNKNEELKVQKLKSKVDEYRKIIDAQVLDQANEKMRGSIHFATQLSQLEQAKKRTKLDEDRISKILSPQ
jgi:hypothetical protein